MKKLTFIDLFAGCGGLSEGFMSSEKFEGIAHVEWEKPMVNTLRRRLEDKWGHSKEDASKRVIHFDIQLTEELISGNWSENTQKDYAETNHLDVIKNGIDGLVGKGKVDLVIGGPPCQAYSIAGRAQDKNGMNDDYRNYLFESFVKVVDAYRPAVFVFENVPGMLSAEPGGVKVTDRIFEAFTAIGYKIRKPEELKNSVCTASEFGVPQKRNRVILIGVNENSDLDLETLYTAVNKQKVDEVKTVKDAIGGNKLPSLIPVKDQAIEKAKNGINVSHKSTSKKNIPFHSPRYNNQRDVETFRYWVSHNMNKEKTPNKIKFYTDRTGKTSNHAKYRNLEWDKPSPTIVAHLYKDGLMFIHPDANQARSITVKEAALLQSFPDDFEFVGSMGSCYKMIGNAVPPEMARRIAVGISDIIRITNN
jgi:DNA (cytosine-5)-methyltransferase 1|tara:strand:+ start:755 stop:2014 length:1260 start_codon:yes stop_codon:yes gene_type:complete